MLLLFSRAVGIMGYLSRGLSVSQAVGSLVCFSLVYRSTMLSFSLAVVLLGRQSTRLSIYWDVPSYIVRNVAISLWTASNGSPGPFVLSNCLPWAPLLSQLSYFSSDSTNGLYLNRLRYSKYNSTCYLKGTCVLISVNTSKHVKRLSFCNIYSSFGGDDDENNDSRSGTCTSTSITTIVLHQTLFFLFVESSLRDQANFNYLKVALKKLYLGVSFGRTILEFKSYIQFLFK